MRLMLALIAATLLIASTTFAANQVVAIDPKQSSIDWVGRKLLGEHHGTVAVKNGEVRLQDGKPVSGKFQIDMQTIAVQDLKDPVDNKKLTGHLKSDDFFGVSLFPIVSVELTKFEFIAGATAGQPNYQVSGIVSIKGITQPLAFPATISVGEGTAVASAVITLDRTKFNVRYGSNKFFDNLGNRVISDNFDVTVKVVGAIS